MCGKPKTPTPQPNYALAREAAESRATQASQRAELKRARLEDRIGMLGNRFGRASLFSGIQGGAGFPAPVARMMFTEA